ncbi:MAG: translational GTPase TypA [Candidatus Pacebacteria bacterium]|nr:translational GTPase TypA [Candidatus Paceibacterota bacterium]MDD2757017.1 translational GTPase TypA [Candidatus Paceibacterota bacterium]MDD3283526.1 translational GTPase TypA [Candidatus Paceibacterota bacterium]MDD3969617.1 translational GTPase TypA [Candidatus Paceibacterota bacterium]MDD4737837.1 translational GTPase TypA [Candidatus Paceibacterota bacterium]
MEIRNIAIIAHVDHGKTSLTDSLMKQSGAVEDSFTMDTNELERERGITIYSKNTSIFYKDTKINIVDTPGHADFSSEVERVLRSIDSVLLVVDAQEGPMPQTKFVLKKSLELGLKPIVVINKIDKPAARPDDVKEMVYELFLDLGANDEQLDFEVVYANGRDGIAKRKIDDDSNNLEPLLDLVLEKVVPASSDELTNKELRAQPFNLGYDNFLGRLAICRIYEGKIKKADDVFVKGLDGQLRKSKIIKMFTFHGLEKVELDEAIAGDIVVVAGIPDIFIGETICINPEVESLPIIHIDEPTISLNFLVNNSPFAGKDGKFVTNRQIKERLEKETEVNVGLKIDFSSTEYYKVNGRGELHIAVLLEKMRREGYELQISQPQVIFKEENGEKLEPYEEVIIDIPSDMSGVVIEKLSKRKGVMTEMKPDTNHTRIIFEIPTRGLLGYKSEFVVDTRGEGILASRVIGFKKYAGEIEKRNVGSMVSMATGKSSGFSLFNLQERGVLYIGHAEDIYEGMVIGNVSKGNDLAVNPTKGKELSNMRSSGADEAIKLTPPDILNIEKGMSIMSEDEYLEITPNFVRLRKQYLTEIERTRQKRKQ